ncbi:MAG TPA: hypothetical protein VEJ86_02005 [Candidatus Binataceae bacterium]|nr:hypothetical protein [Candidatus Binataceae bacterium]
MLGNLIDYIAHLGIVRVLSVPAAMAVIIYFLYRLAAPPPENHDDGATSNG